MAGIFGFFKKRNSPQNQPESAEEAQPRSENATQGDSGNDLGQVAAPTEVKASSEPTLPKSSGEDELSAVASAEIEVRTPAAGRAEGKPELAAPEFPEVQSEIADQVLSPSSPNTSLAPESTPAKEGVVPQTAAEVAGKSPTSMAAAATPASGEGEAPRSARAAAEEKVPAGFEAVSEAETGNTEPSTPVQVKAAAKGTDSTPAKESFFARLKRTRQNLAYGLEAFIVGRRISEELYEELETALLTADLGVETTERVIDRLRLESKARDLHDAGALRQNLRGILAEMLKPCEQELKIAPQDGLPYVILMVGVNGAGKTTTIGKLAGKFLKQGLKVMLAAGDTFRAAAVEQLKEWGERSAVSVISQETGSDSASVIYDAVQAAISRHCDVLICDTAGRLQNKDNLMAELKKIVRVMKKIDERVPQEVMLVLDATTGQNAISQLKLFKEAVPVTGLTVTKLDGSAKGGVIFALADQFKIPLRYVGIGEGIDDLRPFDSEAFVAALVD
ncbi:MAG: signal recognition particle-docking protein FtsY [Succinivibrio sp.]|nr:signal recognition particle-docking protein FtsY [Succinivibrio sp.]